MSAVPMPTVDSLAGAADEALATGRLVVSGDFVLLPDVVLVEGAANGCPPLPRAPVLQRADGRQVHVFALPKGVPA